jgi:hypothetical protein
MKPVTEYLPDPALRAIVENLVAQRRIFVHPKCSATGKVQSKPADLSFGSAPARPEPFVKPSLKAIRKQLSTLSSDLEPFGVDADAVRRAFLDLVAREFADEPGAQPASGAGSGLPAPAVDLANVARQIHERMADMNPAVRTGAMIRLDRLRASCRDFVTEKALFDDAVRFLATTQRVALHRHDDPHGLGPDEREALVPEDHGGLYNAISWRL